MSHPFDTGNPKPQRTLIRQGAISLLAGLKRPAGYLQAVIPWAGVVRSYTDEQGIAQLVSTLGGRAPAIAVCCGDGTWSKSSVGGFAGEKEIEILLYFASNHQRDQLHGRMEIDAVGAADDHADPGLEVMMEHAEELLVGRRPDGTPSLNNIKFIRAAREEELVTIPQVTIWLQTYRVTAQKQYKEFRTVTQLLESIRFRAAIDPDEVVLPDAATDSATIDFNRDDLT